MEEQVCMSIVRRAKKIAKKPTHTRNMEKGRLRKIYTCHTQSTAKLIDYLKTDRGC
jgi:hypothetical protein